MCCIWVGYKKCDLKNTEGLEAEQQNAKRFQGILLCGSGWHLERVELVNIFLQVIHLINQVSFC